VSETTRNRLLNILRVAISLVGVLVIVLTQDMDEVIQLLGGMDWLLFLVGLLLFVFSVPVRAYRWGSLVWALDVQARWWRLVALYFVGSFFNLFLPTGFGGDAVKMFELSRDEHKAAAAISSVLVDRFLGLFVLFALALLTLLSGSGLVAPEVRALIVVVFAASLIGVILILQRTWIEAWGQRLGVDRLLGRIKILRELYESLHVYGPAALLKATAASLVFNLILIVGYYFLGMAVAIHLPLWYYFLFVPIISVLLLVPSVGGLGIREGATVFLFSQVEGVGRSQALALALAYDITMLTIGLLGAIIYIVQGVQGVRK
jgi:uncharacterized protein (TIRG00374 family)